MVSVVSLSESEVTSVKAVGVALPRVVSEGTVILDKYEVLGSRWKTFVVDVPELRTSREDIHSLFGFPRRRLGWQEGTLT